MAEGVEVEAGDIGTRTLRRVTGRILPFVLLLYVVSFIDRVNVGFAAITMNRDLGMSAETFGIGAAVFFVGYAGFEIPSNLVLEKVGARLWIARVMLTWGVVSGGTALVGGPIGFLVARFLLGLAEAGFFPGIILYLSLWFPAARRASIGSVFMLAPPLAGIVGSPLSAWLLGLRDVAGLHGWQWLFLVEALPALLLGIACLFVLTDEPRLATWLAPEERDWLVETMAAERRGVDGTGGHASVWRALQDKRVLLLGAVYFGTSVGLYAVGIWGPLLMHGHGIGLAGTAWLNVLVNAVTVVGMLAWARSSDRRGERLVHVAIPCVLAGMGLLLAGVGTSPELLVVGLTMANVGVNAAKPPLWTLPPSFLTGPAAAAGIALINSLGTLGGAAGPFVIGLAQARTGSAGAGLAAAASILFVSAFLLLPLSRVIRGPVAAGGEVPMHRTILSREIRRS